MQTKLPTFLLFLLLALLLDKIKGNGDEGNAQKLEEEFLGITKAIGTHKLESGEDLEKFLELAIKLQPKRRSAIFETFCTEKGVKEAEVEKRVEKCISEWILHENDDKWKHHLHDLKFWDNSMQNVKELLKMLLMERAHLSAHLLNNALTEPNVKVNTMDTLLEVLLTNTHDELGQIVTVYEKKFGNLKEQLANLEQKAATSPKHRMRVWLNQKLDVDAARAVGEVLSQRVLKLKSRRSIQSEIDGTMHICNTWSDSSMYDSSDDESDKINREEAQQAEKLESDAFALDISNHLKRILEHFEVDSMESQRMADSWIGSCSFIVNHIFKEDTDQKYFDELSRMLLVANLTAPNSRTFYLRQKLQNALDAQHFGEIAQLIATRANIDLGQILSAQFGFCEIDHQQEDKGSPAGSPSRHGKHQRNSSRKLIKTLGDPNQLLQFLVKKTADQHHQHTNNDQTVQQQEEHTNANGAVDRHEGGTCKAPEPNDPSMVAASQIAMFEKILEKHKNNVEEQARILKKMTKRGGKALRSYCKKFEKKEAKLARKKEKNGNTKSPKKDEKEKSAKIKEREHLAEISREFSKEWCKVEKREESKGQEEFIDVFMEMMGQLEQNETKLKEFNLLLKNTNCKTGVKMLNKILELSIFRPHKEMPIFKVAIKMMHVKDPTTDDPKDSIGLDDVKELNEWMHRMRKQRWQDANVGEQAKEHRRRKREPMTVAIVGLVIFLIFIFFLIIVGCAAAAEGDGGVWIACVIILCAIVIILI